MQSVLAEMLSAARRGSASSQATDRGRGAVSTRLLESGREIVFRLYRRGGAARRIARAEHFLPPGRPLEQARPFAELRVLLRLRSLGCMVPVPAGAFASLMAAGFGYRGLIAAERVAGAGDLPDYLAEEGNEAAVSDYFRATGREAARVLQCGVLHRDLHPGNVLIAPDHSVYLIDFDRASTVPPKDAARFATVLCRRWERWLTKRCLRYPAAGRYQGIFEEGLLSELGK